MPDRYAFFMPFYCLAAILIGIGFNFLLPHPNRKILCLAFILSALPIPAYIIAPVVAQKMQFNLTTKRDIPYRNDYIWFLRPWQTGNHGPEKFADEALNTIEKNAVIYADGTTAPPLLYFQQVRQKRPDVKIIASIGSRKNPLEFNERTIEKLLTERAVYIVSPVPGYCPNFLLEQYEFKQDRILWKVVK